MNFEHPILVVRKGTHSMRFYFSGERQIPQLLDELGYFVDDFQRFCRQKLDRKTKQYA